MYVFHLLFTPEEPGSICVWRGEARGELSDICLSELGLNPRPWINFMLLYVLFLLEIRQILANLLVLESKWSVTGI